MTPGAGLSGGGTAGNVTLTNTGVLALAAGTGITSSGGNAPAIGLNTGFTDRRYPQLAGGALSGALNLPANGLVCGGQSVGDLAGGNVGVRTATPRAPLEVAGSLKISAGERPYVPGRDHPGNRGESAGGGREPTATWRC